MSTGAGILARQLGVQPRRIGDVADQAIEPADVLEDDVHQLLPALRIVDARRGLDRAAQGGQRVLQLVGDIGGEALDRVHAQPERLRHVAQRARELADLVAAAAEIGDRVAAVAIAPHPFGGGGQPQDRPGDGAGEIDRQQDR